MRMGARDPEKDDSEERNKGGHASTIHLWPVPSACTDAFLYPSHDNVKRLDSW